MRIRCRLRIIFQNMPILLLWEKNGWLGSKKSILFMRLEMQSEDIFWFQGFFFHWMVKVFWQRCLRLRNVGWTTTRIYMCRVSRIRYSSGKITVLSVKMLGVNKWSKDHTFAASQLHLEVSKNRKRGMKTEKWTFLTELRAFLWSWEASLTKNIFVPLDGHLFSQTESSVSNHQCANRIQKETERSFAEWKIFD